MEKSLNRIIWIDRMRGLAILSVVIQHLTYCFENQFVYHKLIGISNMAVFFFISGYIIEKTSRMTSLQDIRLFLKKKTIQLMLPFIMWQFVVRKFFFATDWQIITWNDVAEGFAHPTLWFLLTLYGYMFAFAGLNLINTFKIKHLNTIWGGNLLCIHTDCTSFCMEDYWQFSSRHTLLPLFFNRNTHVGT